MGCSAELGKLPISICSASKDSDTSQISGHRLVLYQAEFRREADTKQANFCLSELLQPVLFLFRSCLCFLVESGVSLGEEAPVATIHKGACGHSELAK